MCNHSKTMHSHLNLRSNVFSKLFLLLVILSTFFSATTQTKSVAEGETCPLTNDGIGQNIEQMVKEAAESSQVTKHLFTGSHQGWHAKVPLLINALLEKWLWSWTSNSKKAADLKEQFNKMVREILAKIGLYGAEEMPVKMATVHILEEIKTKYLVPMAGKINPDWAEKMSQLGNRSVPPPAQGQQPMEEENPNESQNAAEGEGKEELGRAQFQTELLNYAVGSMEGLLADIKSGKVDKETKRECGKPWKERLAFANSIFGQHLSALKAKVLAMIKAFLVRTKYGGLVMAFANLPGFLSEKNKSTWAWMAKCVGKIRGGGVESVREKAKHLAAGEQKYTASDAVLGGSGQSSGVDFNHREKRARNSPSPPGSRSSHTTYFIFVGGHNPPIFGHQFKFGTSLAIGLAYYTGCCIYMGFVGFVSLGLWVDSEDSRCQRTSAVLFIIFSLLSSIFLLFLPFLNIY